MMNMLSHAVSTVLPEPVFEGSEKRLEVDFALGASAPANGLRSLPRETLDELMTLAHCTIVSDRHNANFDAYVLSESSLFVYPTKWVLKTCGTTRLLDSVTRLLEVTAAHGIAACRCKYTRASFLFPEQQPSPHSSFDEEVAVLNAAFGSLQPDGQGQVYVLGEQDHGLQWHVYVSGRTGAPEPTFNLEMCMTELNEDACQAFFRNDKFVSSHQTTMDTGIVNLLPGADIDDYVFEPCGYSMNGILHHQFITIHVTPEKGFSYASVEISGHTGDLPDCAALLDKAVSIFKPDKVSVAMAVDDANAPNAASWGTLSHLPATYAYVGANGCKLTCGGRVVYYTLEGGADAVAAARTAKGSGCLTPASPKTVLHHSVSLLSLGGGGVGAKGGVGAAAADSASESGGRSASSNGSDCDASDLPATPPSRSSSPTAVPAVAL